MLPEPALIIRIHPERKRNVTRSRSCSRASFFALPTFTPRILHLYDGVAGTGGYGKEKD